MSERLKEHAWKACVRETVPRVRIPLSPPFLFLMVVCGLSALVFNVGPQQIPAGSYAMETHEPREVRKEATVSDNFYVP